MDSQSLRACLARLSEASPAVTDSQLGLQQIISRLSLTLRRDRLVQTTLEGLRQSLQVDRVAGQTHTRRVGIQMDKFDIEVIHVPLSPPDRFPVKPL